MVDPNNLKAASSDQVAESLSQALLYDRRRRVHDADRPSQSRRGEVGGAPGGGWVCGYEAWWRGRAEHERNADSGRTAMSELTLTTEPALVYEDGRKYWYVH